MAIQRIHELPRKLPHARLFLDDIEEISKILVEAYMPHLTKLREGPKISYSVGDLRMDSIDDLQTRGGSATDLRITVGDTGSAEIGFSGFLNPDLALYSLDEQERWALYAKIKSVFDHRQLAIKNAITSLPGWLKVLLYVLVFLVFPNLGGLALSGSRLVLWFLIGYVVFLALLGFTFYRPSRVFFVRSHESSKASSAVRRGYARDLVFLVLGAVIGKLIERLFSYLLK